MMENRDIQELILSVSQRVEQAPPEKQRELEAFLTGYLAALQQVMPKDAKQ